MPLFYRKTGYLASSRTPAAALVALLFCLAALGFSAPLRANNAYVTNQGSNTLSVIDTASNTVTATVGVGNGPYGVAVSPNGARVYVANGGGAIVSVLDTATNTVTATVNVGAGPGGVAVHPDGARVYVANYVNGTVSVLDAATNTVTATVNVGSFPIALGQFIAPTKLPVKAALDLPRWQLFLLAAGFTAVAWRCYAGPLGRNAVKPM